MRLKTLKWIEKVRSNGETGNTVRKGMGYHYRVTDIARALVAAPPPSVPAAVPQTIITGDHEGEPDPITVTIPGVMRHIVLDALRDEWSRILRDTAFTRMTIKRLEDSVGKPSIWSTGAADEPRDRDGMTVAQLHQRIEHSATLWDGLASLSATINGGPALIGGREEFDDLVAARIADA